MDPFGTAALVVAALAGALVALGRRRAPHAELLALGAWCVALAVAVWRFTTVDLRLAEVAALTRQEVPWPLRVAGVWAGPDGSLLTWAVVVLGALAVAARQDPGRIAPRRLLGGASAVAAVSLLVLARPFERLPEAPLAGDGLNPVLEHPMMLVHPPLLYLAQATVLGAAWVGDTGIGDRREVARRRSRWTAAAVALLLAATLLGSWWAHDELGWGGWWAWDPVENTALAPLVCLLAAVHARTGAIARRWRLGAAACVLAGITMTRSGLPDSVHAFAPSGRVAVVFGAATLLVLGRLASTWSPAGADDHGGADPAGAAVADPPRSTGVEPRTVAEWVTGLSAGWIVAVIVAAGLAASWLGTQDPVGAIEGRLLGTLLAPVGAVAVLALLLVGFRRGQGAPSLIAHAGVLVFAVGVVGSTASSTHRGTADLGDTTLLGGHRVTLQEALVVEDRADLVRLDVTATVDGRRVVASILDHPDLDRTRARPGRLVDPGGETELVVTVLADDRARIELRRHPGLPWLWVGGAMAVAGVAWSAVRRRGQPSPPRRRRLASSSESSAEDAAPGPGGG